jgi:hypothetical protein|tara:strand:+ start:149 stop:421 length:273 start_codon:yes stop_codon:yes gene_type:complete
MYSSTIPKTIQKWLDANADKIDEVDVERDEWAGPDGLGDWSIWCWLKLGWKIEGYGGHLIHEASAKDFIEQTKLIVPCECEECVALPIKG